MTGPSPLPLIPLNETAVTFAAATKSSVWGVCEELFTLARARVGSTVTSMAKWKEGQWFGELVSIMREALSEAEYQIENRYSVARYHVDIIVKHTNLHDSPQNLSGTELATQLVMAMTRDRLVGLDLVRFENLYPCLPPLRRVQNALFAPEVQVHVAIPPAPSGTMVDPRISVREFADALTEQVFQRRND